MTNILKQIKGLYNKSREKKLSYEKRGINPKHHWSILLSVTFVMLLCIAIFAFYFYTEINQGKFFTVKNKAIEKEVKIDSALLKKIVDEINLRAKSLKEIKTKTIPQDPSL